MQPSIAQARRQLASYNLQHATLTAVTGGHINRTFLVSDAAARFVLQWVNPIFDPAIHANIEAVTRRLEESGVTTPRLVRTRRGELYTVASDGGVWRLMTFLPGHTHFETRDPDLCHEAGRLAAQFHGALRGLLHAFEGRRLGVHDTQAHLAGLQHAARTHQHHEAYDALAPVAAAILDEARSMPSLAHLEFKPAHGDMKLSNILFTDTRRALAFVDLDTVGPMPWPIELGDAFRSWCADGGEEAEASTFSVPRLEAAIEGYAAHGRDLLSQQEAEALVPATHLICVELAARFARDAFEETYFNWDHSRYEAAWQHNLVRAKSQLCLAKSLAAQRPQAASVVARALRRHG